MFAQPAPDYAPSLAVITQAIKRVETELQQLQGHPSLRLTPTDYRHALTQCSQNAMREAVSQLNQVREASLQTQQALVSMLGAARSRAHQARHLAIVSAIALTTELLLSPLLAHLLPFGLDTRIAAVVIASDRWEAGERLRRRKMQTPGIRSGAPRYSGV